MISGIPLRSRIKVMKFPFQKTLNLPFFLKLPIKILKGKNGKEKKKAPFFVGRNFRQSRKKKIAILWGVASTNFKKGLCDSRSLAEIGGVHDPGIGYHPFG